jgi:hypothetical protein
MIASSVYTRLSRGKTRCRLLFRYESSGPQPAYRKVGLRCCGDTHQNAREGPKLARILGMSSKCVAT